MRFRVVRLINYLDYNSDQVRGGKQVRKLFGLALSLVALGAVAGQSFPYPALAEVSCVAEIKSTPTHPGIIFHQYYLGCLS
ncbi:unnamed protein product, partial [marine sediment metagenome]